MIKISRIRQKVSSKYLHIIAIDPLELHFNENFIHINFPPGILRHQKLADDSEKITLESTTVDLSVLQQATTKLPQNKTTDYIKNEKIKASVPMSKAVIAKLSIQDEFIEEEQTADSEIDSIDKPDVQKKKRKIYRCKRCNKLCNSKNALSYHILSHTGERPFKCDVPECSRVS